MPLWTVFICILIRSNKMQQYAGIYLLQNHSLHVSGVHRTHHQENIKLYCSLWYRSKYLGNNLPPTLPCWRKVVAQILWPVPEAAVTVLCTPDNGCEWHPKHVESDFAVNKYLHTVASCWILLIKRYDAQNHEYKIVFIWLRTGISCRLMWMLWWTFNVRGRWGIF